MAGAAPEEVAQDALSPARWISRANAALLPGDSMLARAQIVTHDPLGGTSHDVLDMARVSEGDATRTLIEVEAPEAGAGTTYEIVARPGRPLERWVWLPELRRLRKIFGVQRTDPFLGTEFTYEDLGLALPVERRAGVARRVGEPPHRLLELESPPYHYYSRVVTRIDPATNLPTTVSFYDRAGQLFREQRFGEVRQIDGRPFPTVIAVRDVQTGAYSVLTFQSVRFDVDIPPQRFSESALRRHLRRAGEALPDALETTPDRGSSGASAAEP
jgi:hypothetical protein